MARRGDRIPRLVVERLGQMAVGKSGPKVPARMPGAGALPAIEDAPGSYVKVRVVE